MIGIKQKQCSVTACNNEYVARGLCRKHYLRLRALGGIKKEKCLVEGCDSYVNAKSFCSKHYERWRKSGDPLKTKTAPTGEPLNYLLAEIGNPKEECMVWPFTLSSAGYGQLHFEGKLRLAHRVALSVSSGEPIETDLYATHGPCHNRACFNPAHLSWGSAKKNSHDRRRDGTFQVGEKTNSAKITTAEAKAIIADSRIYKDIARDYGITASNVGKIKRKEIWGHVG